MRKHPSIAPHPPAAPTIPAVTIGLDLSDKTAHWCALDQAGNVSGRGQLRLTHAELRKHFTTIPPARIALEASGQSAWIADPQHIKRGALMPKVPLSGRELADVRSYLLTLE